MDYRYHSKLSCLDRKATHHTHFTALAGLMVQLFSNSYSIVLGCRGLTDAEILDRGGYLAHFNKSSNLLFWTNLAIFLFVDVETSQTYQSQLTPKYIQAKDSPCIRIMKVDWTIKLPATQTNESRARFDYRNWQSASRNGRTNEIRA